MKRNIKIVMGVLSAAVILLCGCTLDRYPYDSIVVEDVDDNSFETMTLGNYAKMKEEYFFKTIHQYGEYGGDNVSLSGTTSDYLYYHYRYERVNTDHYPLRYWQFTYGIMININNLISLMEAKESNETLDHILGENYFLRALLYFHCCNVFAKPYLDPNGAANNLGLPIKVNPDPDGTDFPSRSSVEAVYKQIIEDAKKAAILMKRVDNPAKKNIYASQETAWALLSRVYLYMGDYVTAGKYCDSVINSDRNYRLLEGDAYKSYSKQVPETNSETIFAVRMTKDVDYAKYNMSFYSVGSMYASINDEGWGEMYPSESYLELLRQNPQDNRFGFISNQTDPSAGMWMIYVDGNESAKTYNYKTNPVILQTDGSWLITDGAETFTSDTVQEETTPDGGTQYYVVTASDGARHNVWIEESCKKRNLYPVRYILKCSQQEGQAQLYSPVMFRLAEMYLTRAECRYHAGDYTGAIADINVIRDRANIPLRSLSDTADPAADVLTWVLDERRLELAWEGHRKYDIFRNQQTLDRRYPGGHLSGTNVNLFIAPGDVRLAEFIPQREIDAYPAGNILEQNP